MGACVGLAMIKGGDMSDMYPSTFSKEEIQRTAEQKFLKYGDDAFAEAAREISALNARGEFSLAGSWVMVCHRIRKLQALNDHEGSLDKNLTLSE